MTREQKTKICEHFDWLHTTASNVPDDLKDVLKAAYLAGAAYALDIYCPHWISVDEELPPLGCSMIVLISYGEDIQISEWDNGLFHEIKLGAIIHPTHWCPLPQLPLVTDLNKKDLPPVSCQEGNILVEEEGGEE